MVSYLYDLLDSEFNLVGFRIAFVFIPWCRLPLALVLRLHFRLMFIIFSQAFWELRSFLWLGLFSSFPSTG